MNLILIDSDELKAKTHKLSELEDTYSKSGDTDSRVMAIHLQGISRKEPMKFKGENICIVDFDLSDECDALWYAAGIKILSELGIFFNTTTL